MTSGSWKKGLCRFFRVVEMWCQHVLGGPYVDKDVDILLVFDSYYHSNATRVYYMNTRSSVLGLSTPIGSRFSATCYGERYARLATVLVFLISQREKLLCSTMPRPSTDRKRPRLGPP